MLFDVFCLLLNFPLQVGTGLLKALQTHKRMLSRTRLHDTADSREKTYLLRLRARVCRD